MSNWKNKLDLRDVWKKVKNGEITVEELGKVVGERIRKLRCYQAQIDILEELAYGFENITDGIDEFDDLLEQLYDWGDTRLSEGFPPDKMCWIATAF